MEDVSPGTATRETKKVALGPNRWLDGPMQGTLGEAIDDAPVKVLDVFPSVRSPPEAVRASLEAIKAAQLAARARRRREMWQARAIVAGVAAVVALGGFVVWPRLRSKNVAKAAKAATVAPAPGPVSAANENPPPAAVPAPGGLLAAGVAALPAVKEAPTAATASADTLLAACRDSYQSKRWRSAAGACASAFAAHPDDATLALRVAEAEYARDHLNEACEWARRTLALDAKQADALAILGRSEQRAGHGEAAARDFRRYLALAPRGWHAAEARAALRRDNARARPAGSTAARASQPRERDENVAPVPAAEPSSAERASAEPPATAPAAFAPPPSAETAR
jgi:tetratricopeptide (TPR) repeat protein